MNLDASAETPVVAEVSPPRPLVMELSHKKPPLERRRQIISRLFALMLAAIILSMKSGWKPTGFVDDLLFASGVVMATIGCLGRIWCNMFIAGYKTKELITIGPYSVCRNPLYFFSGVGMVGIGLMTGTVTIPFILVISFVCYYPIIIRSEERRLRERHGSKFIAYCRCTPAFFPRLSLLVEPATHLVHTKAFRKTLTDAVWFIWLMALVHVTHELHQFGQLPSWMICY